MFNILLIFISDWHCFPSGYKFVSLQPPHTVLVAREGQVKVSHIPLVVLKHKEPVSSFKAHMFFCKISLKLIKNMIDFGGGVRTFWEFL